MCLACDMLFAVAISWIRRFVCRLLLSFSGMTKIQALCLYRLLVGRCLGVDSESTNVFVLISYQ